MNTHIIKVDQSGKGDFTTINDALDSIEELDENIPVRIELAPGEYYERLEILRPHITLVGENADTTFITHSLYAFMLMADGTKRGTFRSYSVLIDTNDFTAENITFENASGDGGEVGQALAIYSEGDMIKYINCCFLGCQDTIFTGPLPPKELQPGGFIGPKQFAPRINGRQYYKDCFIRGDIDFIFGSSTAYFENCEIFSNNRGKEINGYVTAPSTPEGQEYGYVFEGCHFTSNCPADSVYLDVRGATMQRQYFSTVRWMHISDMKGLTTGIKKLHTRPHTGQSTTAPEKVPRVSVYLGHTSLLTRRLPTTAAGMSLDFNFKRR